MSVRHYSFNAKLLEKGTMYFGPLWVPYLVSRLVPLQRYTVGYPLFCIRSPRNGLLCPTARAILLCTEATYGMQSEEERATYCVQNEKERTT